MKRLSKLIGIVALVTIIGFSFAVLVSCDTGFGGSNPFVGRWAGNGITVVCTETTWTATIYGWTYQGTYTRNGNRATFNERGGGVFGTATVSRNTMTVIERAYGTVYTLYR